MISTRLPVLWRQAILAAQSRYCRSSRSKKPPVPLWTVATVEELQQKQQIPPSCSRGIPIICVCRGEQTLCQTDGDCRVGTDHNCYIPRRPRNSSGGNGVLFFNALPRPDRLGFAMK